MRAILAFCVVACLCGAVTAGDVEGSALFVPSDTSPDIRAVDASVGVGLTKFTLSSWIRVSSVPSDFNVIVAKNRLPFGTGVNFGIKPDVSGGVFAFSCGVNNNAVNVVVDGLVSIPLNTWVNAMCTWDGMTLSLYRNGVFDNSFSIDASAAPVYPMMSSSLPWTIGSENTVPNRQFAGAIDNVRIWNAALSAEDVAGLWNAELTPGADPSLLHWVVFRPAEVPASASATSDGSRRLSWADLGSSRTAWIAANTNPGLSLLTAHTNPPACPAREEGCGSPCDGVPQLCSSVDGSDCQWSRCDRSAAASRLPPAFLAALPLCAALVFLPAAI